MKLIIAGSRTAPPALADRIDDLVKAHGWDVAEVVSGCCFGPDKWGEQWAAANGIKVVRYPANWSMFGKRAGVVRNKQMALYADAALVFWDCASRGTANMVEEMQKLRKQVSVCGFGAKPAGKTGGE